MSHLVHCFAAVLADASFLAVRRHAGADSRRLVAAGANGHDLGDEQRRVLLDDAGLHDARIGLGVAFDDVHAGHDHAVLAMLLAHHPLDLAALALVFTRKHVHGVVLLDACQGHHSTSGASDTIFMKLRSRNSRATGPKMRVPRGLFWGLMSTAALSSKRIYEPSGR